MDRRVGRNATERLLAIKSHELAGNNSNREPLRQDFRGGVAGAKMESQSWITPSSQWKMEHAFRKLKRAVVLGRLLSCPHDLFVQPCCVR